MLKRFLTIAACLLALTSLPVQAIYFPAGIDWTNPSQQRFVQSLYLNALGRAPSAAETRAGTRYLSREDDAQTRLDLFQRTIKSGEYRQAFPDTSQNWRVYRAADRNYSSGHWRYRAAAVTPSGFERWELSGVSTESVARAMATYYQSYCYQGIPCIAEPAVARSRFEPVMAADTHACADEQAQTAQFQWIAVNGTTYPKGTDANTLCMGAHYYHAVGTTLQRYECEAGYRNCERNRSRDIRAERSGDDARGNPGVVFSVMAPGWY